MAKYFTNNILVIVAITIAAGLFNFVPIFAQGGNQTMTNTTTTEEHSEEYTEGISVRDSATLLLQDMIIPAQDFIHLYDSTPDMILKGHVAVKIPCGDDSVSPIQVLIGSAPQLAPAELENLANLSKPGDLCLYHVDLMPSGNVSKITDIALMNPTEDDIEFPVTSTVVIGINEIAKGEHESHEAAEAGHSEPVEGT
ncbi:MAG TPA: hypothetical protein VJ767_11285 [Nitrososphaeraceae archaeon]|nr:hypothetical protein [Nitrososphaeraceae archaeon]